MELFSGGNQGPSGISVANTTQWANTVQEGSHNNRGGQRGLCVYCNPFAADGSTGPYPGRRDPPSPCSIHGSPCCIHVHRGVLLLIHTQNPCGQVVFQLEEAKPGFAPRTRCFQSWKSFPRILQAPREEGSGSW